MTLTFEAVKRWVNEQFYSKREHISATRGSADAHRPVIVGSDGLLDGSLLDRADIFSDAEGDPANIGTAADGASTYAARRNHVHAATNAGITTAMFSDAEGDPAAVGTAADGTSTYASRRDHVHDIAANYVDNTRLADMAQATIKGRASAAGTGDPTDLTAAQVMTILTTTGTWTPALTFGGGSTGITYTTRVARYIRIGDLVVTTFYIVLSNKGSSTGNAAITMPVASANVSSAHHAVSVWANTLTGVSGHLAGWIAANSTTLTLEFLATGTITALADTHFQNTTAIMVTATYLAA